MASNMPDRVLGSGLPDDNKRHAVTWPFPSAPPEHDRLYKLPFNPENEEDAPL